MEELIKFDFKKMEKSFKKIKKMRSDIIEKTINIEGYLDEILIQTFSVENDIFFRIDFLYGESPISLKKKIETIGKINNKKYKKLSDKLKRLETIRNHFSHSPTATFEIPMLISKAIKPVNAETEFKEFNTIYSECLFSLGQIIKELKRIESPKRLSNALSLDKL